VQEMCSALSRPARRKKLDESIQRGFQWLLRMITRMWEDLDDRVKTDIEEKAANEKREKAERTKRVQLSRELRCSMLDNGQSLKWKIKGGETVHSIFGSPFVAVGP